ncbi:MAG: hypothetical protein E2O82_05090 [Betaproteobacteria bacterium]|nr:MAG: hypothetical protein E2O82_05090 [Betaproteobacteria bacterium]
MIEVDVLYADLSRQRVLFENKENLSTIDVLALTIQTDEEVGKLRNIAVSHGFDYYALCWGIQHSQLWVEIYQWDDGDFMRRRASNPHDADAKNEFLVPLACKHIVFHGVEVTDAEWAKALKIMDKEML